MAVADLTVSSQAAALIELVEHLPVQSLRDLERLLLADLAAPSGAELREARLGLLIEMVADATGELPSTIDYDQLRARRRRVGERWPDASVLGRAYGSWPVAVRAAMRLALVGPSQRVAHTHQHAHRYTRYTRDEVLAALARFRREHHGRWPTSTQYFSWAEQLRRAARNGGHPDPRLPTPRALRRHFPRFALALAAAQLASDEGRLPCR